MAQQRAGFCQLVRSCLWGPLSSRPLAGSSAASWNQLSDADPCSHWLFWGPPSSKEWDALCSLLREGDPVRLLLPKLRAEAQSLASLRSAALPRELCISNLLQ